MFFALAALVAVLIALAARRPVHRLAERSFHRVGLLWPAAGLYLLFVPEVLAPALSMSLIPGLPPLGGLLYVASLLLLLLFAWPNRQLPGLPLIALGLLLNAAVIASNGGRMPVDPGILAARGTLEKALAVDAGPSWSRHTLMRPGTPLALLGDWLLVPLPFRNPTIVSVGDLAIACGILLFFLLIPERPRAAAPSPYP